jgi:riboflavin synthase
VRFSCVAVPETLRRTTLERLRPRDRVNLERAATLEKTLGGHWLQGHVDGVGRVRRIERRGGERLLHVEVPESIWPYIVPKGSVGIDGVSLTVADLRPGRVVVVAIVPYTWDHTTIHTYRVGRRVNLEADLVGKVVDRLLRHRLGGTKPESER